MSQQRSRLTTAVLLPTAAAAGLFAALVLSVTRQPNTLSNFDAEVAQTLHTQAAANPELKGIFQSITYVGSLETLLVVAFVASVTLLPFRRWWLTVAWVLMLAGGEYLNRWIKDAVGRPRPEFHHAKGLSFPSGHAMMSFIGYGMLAYVLAVTLPRAGVRILLVAVLVLLIGFSRLFLGDHYFSDVLGGYAIGAVWLGIWITVLEGFRRRPNPTERTTASHALFRKDRP